MQGILYEEPSFWLFALVTVLMGGWAAWMTGRAMAMTWQPYLLCVVYLLILAGAGYGAGVPALGWAAAALAALTAYTRELGRTCGLPADFSGPMAKQHRMATITAAALLSLLEPLWQGRNDVLAMALWIIVVGAAVTAFRRAARTVQALRAR